MFFYTFIIDESTKGEDECSGVGDLSEILRRYTISKFLYFSKESQPVSKFFKSSLFPFLNIIQLVGTIVNVNDLCNLTTTTKSYEPSKHCVVHFREHGCAFCQCLKYSFQMFSSGCTLMAKTQPRKESILQSFVRINSSDLECGTYYFDKLKITIERSPSVRRERTPSPIVPPRRRQSYQRRVYQNKESPPYVPRTPSPQGRFRPIGVRRNNFDISRLRNRNRYQAYKY